MLLGFSTVKFVSFLLIRDGMIFDHCLFDSG